jgi:IS1 family transposase
VWYICAFGFTVWGAHFIFSGRRGGWCLIAIALCFDFVAAGSVIAGRLPWDWGRRLGDGQENREQNPSHSDNTVTQKYSLTNLNSCITVIGIGRTDMPNVLDKDKQIAIISALTEGSSIRSVERITGVHRDTIMRLGVRVGEGCARLLDAKMRNLPCQQLQFDEVWGFIGKKQKNVRNEDDQQLGDVWTFCAIDSDTKIVPSFKVGKRDHITANAFVQDVANRMANRVQISSDALNVYVPAIEQAFGADVDFAQIIKTYEEDYQHPERKYSPASFVSAEKNSVMGVPDMELVSTSHVERLNGTTRLHMRRLTRLTYAFSKKFENFEAAVALHFASYNFVKRHNTLRCTPAMAAGIERDFWTVGDLAEAAA